MEFFRESAFYLRLVGFGHGGRHIDYIIGNAGVFFA